MLWSPPKVMSFGCGHERPADEAEDGEMEGRREPSWV